MRDRRARGRVVWRQGGQLAARGAPQDRVDELVPAAAPALGELDALADGGVRGDAVEEDELVEPEPQRRERLGIELVRRARELLDVMVERELALHRAVGELHRQRPLARVEAARLAVQGAVGVGALLEDAPDDRVGDPPGGRDARAVSYQRTGTSYACIALSEETRVAPSIRAWAMSRRSKGSR